MSRKNIKSLLMDSVLRSKQRSKYHANKRLNSSTSLQVHGEDLQLHCASKKVHGEGLQLHGANKKVYGEGLKLHCANPKAQESFFKIENPIDDWILTE